MADAPNQGRPIPRNNAVEQKEAAALWWQQAGGEAASHRKPTFESFEEGGVTMVALLFACLAENGFGEIIIVSKATRHNWLP